MLQNICLLKPAQIVSEIFGNTGKSPFPFANYQ